MSRPYDAYRASDVPWVERIPSGWQTVPLFSVLKETKVKNAGLVESNLLSLSYGRIVRKDIEAVGGLLPESFETYQIVEPDQLVFRFTDLQNDQRSLRSARVLERGIITSAYASARPKGIEPRFAEYLMRSYDMTKVFYGLGGGVRQSLKFSDVARLPVLLPTPAEQRAIADYLDRETARIDTLIEEQQRLVELLRERRQGVLSRASDGDWPTASLGLLLDGIKDGTHGSFARTPPGEGMPLLGARNVMGSRVLLDGAESFISNDDYESIVANGFPARGDVLLVIVGATIGKTAVYDLETRHAFQRSVAFLRPSGRLESTFLWYQIQASRFQDELTLRAKTSAQPGIYLGDVAAIGVGVPPLETQRQIVAYLNEQTTKIDALIAETERFIALSNERRSALITAAVTGQIDVREVVA